MSVNHLVCLFFLTGKSPPHGSEAHANGHPPLFQPIFQVRVVYPRRNILEMESLELFFLLVGYIWQKYTDLLLKCFQGSDSHHRMPHCAGQFWTQSLPQEDSVVFQPWMEAFEEASIR